MIMLPAVEVDIGDDLLSIRDCGIQRQGPVEGFRLPGKGPRPMSKHKRPTNL